MKLNEAVVIQSQHTDALKDSDTIRVYHGTSDPNFLTLALTRGLSGGMRVSRRYSYEANNNPRGLFVSPDLRTAKEFGDYIIEFQTRVADLEAPVWPGGSFTVQGGMSGIFSGDDEREAERMRRRGRFSQSEFEYIRNSDRPELAALLIFGGERQALFTGNLNANSIRAVWVSRDPTRIGQQYERYKPSEVLDMANSGTLPTRFGSNYSSKNIEGDLYRSVKNKVVNPRDSIGLDEFIDRLQTSRKIKIPREEIIEILKDNPDYVTRYVWSDEQANRIFRELERT